MSHYILLIDVSQSMCSCIQTVISGINSFIDRLKYISYQEVYLSIVVFNNTRKYIRRFEKITENTQYVDTSDFITTGATLLYDTVVTTILEWYLNSNSIKSHMFIITDGCDNRSVCTNKKITEQVCLTAVNMYGWEITHCGVTPTSLINSIPYTQLHSEKDISDIFSTLVIID